MSAGGKNPNDCVSHTGVVPEQVESSTHWTQFPAALQRLAPASVHCALLVQPAWHVRVPPAPARQTGVLGEVQSELVRHATHVDVAVSQRGVEPEQLLSDSHCTQRFVVESQTGVAVGQSEAERQPTHAPVDGSHRLGCPAPVGHVAPPSPPHAAWHV